MPKRWTIESGHHLREPKLADARQEIEQHLHNTGSSFRETDGIVRNKDAIWSILCLKLALRLLPRKEKK